MERIFRICVLFLVFLCNQHIRAEVITTYSINSETIQELQKWIDKNTLILIEIDNSLVIPKSVMFSANNNPYKSFIQDIINLGRRDSAYNLTLAKWYEQRKIMLVEDGWKDFINYAKNAGAKVYGLCVMPINLQNIEKKRYSEISELGIEFSLELNGKEVVDIGGSSRWPNKFYKGIIFTGALTRSNSLLNLLKVSNTVPGKVLVIGAIESEMQHIDKSISTFKTIENKNVVYLGLMEMPVAKLDEKVIKFQQQQLLKHGIWLEDEEAKDFLAKSEQK